MSGLHHHPTGDRGRRRLGLALICTLVVMVVEFVVGWRTGSLSLMADAGHMLADSAALALSLFVAWFASRPATVEKTYGYYRTEILAALANGITLWGIVVWIAIQAFERLRHPLPVPGLSLMAVAALGLGANLFVAWMLDRDRGSSLNVQGAWLNVMSDALGSLGVIVAGALIHLFGWTAADPIAGLLIGILIAASSWTLIQHSVNILLEGTPTHLTTDAVSQALRQVSGVRDVHDVHLWTITTGMEAMSGHIVIDDPARSSAMLASLSAVLTGRFNIRHSTLQLEPREHLCQMRAGALGDGH